VTHTLINSYTLVMTVGLC